MGGLPVFGYPISEAFLEQIEGRWYMVQYFGRQRFEWHYDPDNSESRNQSFEGVLVAADAECPTRSARG